MRSGFYLEAADLHPTFQTEWTLRTRTLDASLWKCSEKSAAGVGQLLRRWHEVSAGERTHKAEMDQASGGEDPNKPSKKKANEDEGKNKKLVCIESGSLVVHV